MNKTQFIQGLRASFGSDASAKHIIAKNAKRSSGYLQCVQVSVVKSGPVKASGSRNHVED